MMVDASLLEYERDVGQSRAEKSQPLAFKTQAEAEKQIKTVCVEKR
jgi:hypothetical protein